MKNDISSRADIKQIISEFYKKLIKDEQMYPFFKEIVEGNTLEHHLEIITDFWEDLLFQTYKYKNNPMKVHTDFHQKIKFKKEHFCTWLNYLSETIDFLHDGELAHQMKNRAKSIATVMQIKMDLYAN